jgi:hypothetical protein
MRLCYPCSLKQLDYPFAVAAPGLEDEPPVMSDQTRVLRRVTQAGSTPPRLRPSKRFTTASVEEVKRTVVDG